MSVVLTTIFSSMPFLWRGLFVTIEVAIVVVCVSLVVGLLLGVIVTYGPLPARVLVRLFSDVIRGIPILVLIFFVYYGLPLTGLNLSNFVVKENAPTTSLTRSNQGTPGAPAPAPARRKLGPAAPIPRTAAGCSSN